MKRFIALFLLLILLTGCAAEAPADPTEPSGTAGTVPATSEPTVNVGTSTFPGLGSTMPELTVTTADGQTLTLSALLEEKELVVLNFWYEDCVWCMKEFPVMEVAYQNYREDVQILALNPSDGAEAVKAFQESRGMSISMAACSASLPRAYGVSMYPTSIFIDREGVVCLILVGAVTTSQAWATLFDTFTGDDYQQKIYSGVEEILG